jgi:hypothetical protein
VGSFVRKREISCTESHPVGVYNAHPGTRVSARHFQSTIGPAGWHIRPRHSPTRANGPMFSVTISGYITTVCRGQSIQRMLTRLMGLRIFGSSQRAPSLSVDRPWRKHQRERGIRRTDEHSRLVCRAKRGVPQFNRQLLDA